MAPGILARAIHRDEALQGSSMGGAGGGVPDMQNSKIPNRHPRRVAESVVGDTCLELRARNRNLGVISMSLPSTYLLDP